MSVSDDEELYLNLHRSITKLGYIDPIIVNIKNDRNTIVAGNQRYTIMCDMAKDNGVKLCDTEVDAVVVEYNEDTEMAANIAHNNIHGDWLTIKLREELESLKSISDELFEVTGFDEEQLAEMLAVDEEDEEHEDEKDFAFKVYLPSAYEQLYDMYISLHSEDELKKQVMKILTGAGNGK